jgi:hypothetical protein
MPHLEVCCGKALLVSGSEFLNWLRARDLPLMDWGFMTTNTACGHGQQTEITISTVQFRTSTFR